MLIDRRRLVLSMALAPLARVRVAHADEQRGLFWTATPTGKPPSVLFGYGRAAVSVTTDIVKDGDRFAQPTKRLVGDVGNVKLPPISFPHDALAPVGSRVSPGTAERIRVVVDKSFPAMPNRDKLSAVEIVFLLLSEGQTLAQPTVGGAIAEHAQAAGKPISFLVTLDDVKAAYHPPDIPKLDQKIDEKALTYMLDSRDRIGPIGKHEEDLYAERRTADLARFVAGMTEHGVPGQSALLPTGPLEDTIIDRSLKAVQNAQDQAFFMLPVGTLTRDGGILDKMRQAGVKIVLLA